MKVNDLCPVCLDEGVDPPGMVSRHLRTKHVDNVLSEAKTLTGTESENPHTNPDDPQETSAER